MRLIPQALRRGPWRELSDVDVLQSLCVCLVACMASGGLLAGFYFVRTWRIAAHAPSRPRRARTLLLFGKRLENGVVDGDYQARIARAHALIAANSGETLALLGGAGEAQAALRELRDRGLPPSLQVIVDDDSYDTLENLRNARRLLGERARAPVALVSSRTHLPRCALLAHRLGFDAELCAAEEHFVVDGANIRRLALEAGYILWIDIGTRWAKWTRQRRVVAQIS